MKKPLWIIGLALVVCVGTLFIENFLWIAQTCKTDPTAVLCEDRSLNRSFYKTLENCKGVMEKNASPFICSKGPSVEKMGERFSSVEVSYISSTQQLEKRKSLMTAKSQPVILAAFTVFLLVAFIWRLIVQLRRRN